MYVCMYFKAQNNIKTMIEQNKELTKKDWWYSYHASLSEYKFFINI